MLPIHIVRIRILPWFVSWMMSHSTPLTHNHISGAIRGNCFDFSAEVSSPVPWLGAHLERLRTCNVDTACWEASYAWLKMLGFQPEESGCRLLHGWPWGVSVLKMQVAGKIREGILNEITLVETNLIQMEKFCPWKISFANCHFSLHFQAAWPEGLVEFSRLRCPESIHSFPTTDIEQSMVGFK